MKKNIGKKRIIKERPRLSVFKSNKYIFAQIIDDSRGETIVGVSEKNILSEGKTKKDSAKELGFKIAKMALDKKVKEVVFDRGRYAYHGRIKEVAEGAREGGLVF